MQREFAAPMRLALLPAINDFPRFERYLTAAILLGNSDT